MKNPVIFVLMHGQAYGLYRDLEESLEEFFADTVTSSDENCFDLKSIDLDEIRGAGVYVATAEMYDDGPGDYPGTREAAVRLVEQREITDAEWKAFREGDHPWR